MNKLQYKRILRKYKRLLKKKAKVVYKNPWDYGPILDFLICDLKFMLEYYENNYNVYQSDDERCEVIKEIKQTLKEYESWQTLICDDSIESVDVKIKELQHHKRKFFYLLYDNLENWWD